MAELAVFAGVLSICLPAFAEEYYTFSSRHYDILTTHSPQLASEIAERLEVVFGSYTILFQSDEVSQVRFTVRVFRDRSEFLNFARASGIQGAESAGAIFSPRNREILSFYRGRKSEMFASLYHECFHQFIHHFLAYVPVWFDEGLAMCYETAQVDVARGVVQFGKKQEAFAEVIQHAHLAGNYPHLGTLVRMDHETFYKRGAVLNYADAWSFCYFLMTSEGGRYSGYSFEYFQVLRKEGPAAANEKVFPDAVLTALEPEWIAYTKRL